MSTDSIDPNKNPTEVPPKDTKTELTEEELAKVSGGSVSLAYGESQVKYKPQTSDGPKSP